MKGSPAKLGTIQGTAGHTSALKMMKEKESALKLMQEKSKRTKPDPRRPSKDVDPRKPSADRMKEIKRIGKEKGMAKKSPMELNPSYVTTFDADGNATKKMVSDAKADAIEKSGKARNKKGDVSNATVERTGLSEYKYQMKEYDKKGGYKKQSSEQNLNDSYAKSDASKSKPKTATGNYNRAQKALKDSKTNPEVIAEEKKQAQKFPKDVKDSVKMRNIKTNRSVKDKDDEITTRGQEANSAIEKKKQDARNKKQIKAKQNKKVQLADKKKSETKKKA